jgi:hypothetical protein
MWKDARYIRSQYENDVFESLGSVHITSNLQYDPNNMFVYVPIDPVIAYNCQHILRNEGFYLRGNIYYNQQAGK